MAVNTVLRIKRKRTEDPLQILLTQDEPSPLQTSTVDAAQPDQAAKRRRVWQLSRSSDHRGIPVPLTTKRPSTATTTEAADSSVPTKSLAPPRFSIRKRKSQEGARQPDDYRRVLDLERRQESADASIELDALDKAALAPDPRLADMLSEYLQTAAEEQAAQDDVEMKEEDYVYDIYYPSAAAEAIAMAQEALQSNYGLLEHFNWDDVDQLVIEEEDSDEEGHDSEDSNAESWAGNDYPDEDDEDSDASEDDFRQSGSEEEWDQDDWLDD